MVQIDLERCNGCGICFKSCPADVIRMDKVRKKAVVQYPEDCVTCCWCYVDCPEEAVILMPVLKTSPLFTSWG